MGCYTSADTVTAMLQRSIVAEGRAQASMSSSPGTHHSPLQVGPLKVCCLGRPGALQWSVIV